MPDGVGSLKLLGPLHSYEPQSSFEQLGNLTSAVVISEDVIVDHASANSEAVLN